MTKSVNNHVACSCCGAPTAVCQTCGTTFWVKPNTVAKFCSNECYGLSRQGEKRVARPKRPDQQHLRRLPSHPLAPPSGYLAVARIVLYEKIGPGPHPCHWCGSDIDWVAGGHTVPGALLADHLDWDRANDDADNLVPSCNACNAHRREDHSRALIRPGEQTVLRGGRPTRAVEQNCETCGSPFLTVPAVLRAGNGRFCSRTCARKAPRLR